MPEKIETHRVEGVADILDLRAAARASFLSAAARLSFSLYISKGKARNVSDKDEVENYVRF